MTTRKTTNAGPFLIAIALLLKVIPNPVTLVISTVMIIAGAILMIPYFRERHQGQPRRFRTTLIVGSICVLAIVADAAMRLFE